MANHKSAEKRARVALRRNTINRKSMGEVRSLERQVRKAIANKDKKESATILVQFESKVQKVARKGRLPKTTASRKVSRLSKAIAAL